MTEDDTVRNSRQLEVIDLLRDANSVPGEQLGGRRRRSDDQRQRRTAGRRGLGESVIAR